MSRCTVRPKMEGEESMQRTNSLVLGLIALFVLGGSLVLFSCGGGDDTTNINASNAAFQVGGKSFTFTTTTVFGVASATLSFNAPATRFTLTAGNSAATGTVGYGDGSCTFTVGAGNFGGGAGAQRGQGVTGGPCGNQQ